jgi:S-formylglutathione hydrolase FrmB
MRRGLPRARAGLVGAALTATVLVPLLGARTAPASAVNVPTPTCVARSTPIPSGPATLASQTTMPGYGGRLLKVVLNSPAMGDQQPVYVLLPPNYDPSGAVKYPVLYLLHGSGGSYADWINHGVEDDIDYTTVADHLVPFITVMPSDGTWGYYTNWYGNDLTDNLSKPPPAWETYDIDELIPWVDGHFPVNASRSGRAIAGLSMGGFGAMSYASRYPDLFAAAGSFSGVTDTDIDYPVGGELLNALSVAFTESTPDLCVWGDPVLQSAVWHGGDPDYLASNLADTSLFVASGNGNAGTYDKPGETEEVDGAIESFIYSMNQQFAAALTTDHIAFTKYFYGAGTHSWGYWLRDLAHFLPQLSAVFSHPTTAHPTDFSFRTVDTAFSEWGYSFGVQHVAEDFTYLNNVSPSAMTVTGTGVLSVSTPPNYVPGGFYRIAITPIGGSGSLPVTNLSLEADSSGHLSYVINLGGPDLVQQFDFSDAVPAGFQRVQIGITQAPKPVAEG